VFKGKHFFVSTPTVLSRYLLISDDTDIRCLHCLAIHLSFPPEAHYETSFKKEVSRPISPEKHKETERIIIRPSIVLAKPLCCFHD
jgi:hypothetical protein